MAGFTQVYSGLLTIFHEFPLFSFKGFASSGTLILPSRHGFWSQCNQLRLVRQSGLTQPPNHRPSGDGGRPTDTSRGIPWNAGEISLLAHGSGRNLHCVGWIPSGNLVGLPYFCWLKQRNPPCLGKMPKSPLLGLSMSLPPCFILVGRMSPVVIRPKVT